MNRLINYGLISLYRLKPVWIEDTMDVSDIIDFKKNTDVSDKIDLNRKL